MTVHPHVRGAYSAMRFLADSAAGSSPRAWGIPMNVGEGVPSVRFIPTCVGHTGALEVTPP